MKKVQVDTAFIMHWVAENGIQYFAEKCKDERPFADLGIEVTIILKLILNI
jgi:hypothetical protein